MGYSTEQAEVTALKALTWLSGKDDLLQSFFAATGSGVDDVRERASDAEYLASVFDFLMMADEWVIEFCDTHGLSYEAIQQARAALPGGDVPNWT